jgi:two-component system, OmpR family, response regulator
MADAGKTELEHAQAPLISGLSPHSSPSPLATLVHEIRDPLAPIRNAAELLRTLCDDPRQLHAIAVIERQVLKLTRVLDDALENTDSSENTDLSPDASVRWRGHPPVTARRVLVVDDHADSARSLAQVLACSGHAVLTATSGEQALVLADDFQPEAIVIDIGLPGMDGFDLATQLRERPGTNHSLLLALSGFSLKQFRDNDSYSMFRHYLLKPTSPYTIMYIIEHSLDDEPSA